MLWHASAVEIEWSPTFQAISLRYSSFIHYATMHDPFEIVSLQTEIKENVIRTFFTSSSLSGTSKNYVSCSTTFTLTVFLQECSRRFLSHFANLKFSTTCCSYSWGELKHKKNGVFILMDNLEVICDFDRHNPGVTPLKKHWYQAWT